MDVPVAGGTLAFEGWRFDPRVGGLLRRDASGVWVLVSVGARARDVLAFLLERPGALVSKDAIMDAVWPDVVVEPNNLTVQIAALRRVLDVGRAGDSCIQTVPGRGYRFVLLVTRLGEAQPGLPSAVVAKPIALPASMPRPRRPLWHWLAAGLCAMGLAGLLVAAVWHGGWFAGTPSPPRLSIVVLPFENLSGDPKDDLVTGITDDLTTALSHIAGTFVISRATAYTYRGKSEDIRQIGRELDVRYIVRGSVRRLGQTLRVNAELGSTENGAQLWSDSFDQTTGDLAAGQEQIVIRMRAALNISLVDIEAARGLRERPANPEAFDLILRARATEMLPQTRETVAKVLEFYDQALQRDPDAVLALSGAAIASLAAYFLDAATYADAIQRAVGYLKRAQALEPNGESVLVAQSTVADFRQDGLDHRRAVAELKAVAQKLVDLYPNNPIGYFRLGVVARNEGKYDEASRYFARTIRLDPRSNMIRNLYYNMAFSNVWGGHDQEGLEWADRATGAAGGLPAWRLKGLLELRAVAYVRTGDIETAKRVATDLDDRYPFATWRDHGPDDPGSQQARERAQSFVDALRATGMRDHVDPDADFGVAPDDVLHVEFGDSIPANTLAAGTPTTAPGVTTLSTAQLAGMLPDRKPLVIDTMAFTWYRSIPGAVGLEFGYGGLQGTFSDEAQKRIEQKLHKLTAGDMTKPIVAMGLNSVSFDGYDLALRLRHAGYTNVYWYRGGREAWEVAGMPEDVVRPADW